MTESYTEKYYELCTSYKAEVAMNVKLLIQHKEMKEALEAVVERYETKGSIADFGVSVGIYTVCKNALEKIK